MFKNNTYAEVLDVVSKLNRPESRGLFYNYINPLTGNWGAKRASIGNGVNWYLLNMSLNNTKEKQFRFLFIDTVECALSKFLHVSKGGLAYLADFNEGIINHTMQMTSCLVGKCFQ